MDGNLIEGSTMKIRAYNETDLPAMIAIWNEVVDDGIAFPQGLCINYSYILLV